MSAGEGGYASRGGIKLAHALDAFNLDVTGLICADFGCSTGGFTDCLLQRGAAKVYAIDTGYGVLDYRLRIDDRVIVMERTNALHARLPADSPSPSGRGVRGEGSLQSGDTDSRKKEEENPHPNPLPEGEGVVDLVTIDLGWTRQQHAIPVALRWLKPDGRIITLVKPHYELDADEKQQLLREGVLTPVDAENVFHRVEASMPSLGAKVLFTAKSPIRGSKSARKSGGGNVEYLILARSNS